MTSKKQISARILAIGDELTTGQSLDTNSPWISQQLGLCGIETISHTTVADDQSVIASTIKQLAGSADIVIVTGGLGPTPDDLTRQGLAEASARIRLSQEATVEDSKRAIAIIDQYLRRGGMDRETGKFDIDIIATGISHSQHERMRSLIDLIKRLCNESSDGNASRSDIISEAEISGMESRRVEEALDRLKRNGQIYEPMHGKYRITEY